MMEANVSLKRIEKFLKSEEIKSHHIRRTIPEFMNGNTIRIKSGKFY